MYISTRTNGKWNIWSLIKGHSRMILMILEIHVHSTLAKKVHIGKNKGNPNPDTIQDTRTCTCIAACRCFRGALNAVCFTIQLAEVQTEYCQHGDQPGQL